MLVVFDLDDTLFPEIDYLLSAYRAIADDVGRRGLMSSDDAYRLLVDNCGRTAFDALAAQVPMSVSRMLEIYRTHRPTIALSDDVISVLDTLVSNPLISALGLMTDGRAGTQSAKIDALGLRGWIAPEMVVISEVVGGDKLSGVPQREIELRSGLSGRDICYVGDNPAKDFVEANRRGWHTIFIKPSPLAIHPADIEAVQSDYRPEWTLATITELPALISRLASE